MRFDRYATVKPEWIDHNGHMNVAYYVLAFDVGIDLLWEELGLGPAYRARGLTTFAAETWEAYRRELMAGAPISLQATIMAFDDKRLLVRGQLFHAEQGWLSAETEGLFLSVGLAERRVSPWPADVQASFRRFQAAWPDDRPPRRLALRPGAERPSDGESKAEEATP